MHKLVALTISTLLALAPLPTRASAVAPDWTQLRQVVAAEMSESHVTGAAVAVVSRDRVLFLEGFGAAEIGENRPVTPATCFRIGSLTKTLTAAALGRLAARGRLELDRPVGTYISGLPGRLGVPTLTQLLSHQGGLIDRVDRDGPPEERAAAAFVSQFRADDTFTAAGEVFSYSSLGYALAGQAAAMNEGLSFADLMRREIFEPTGMRSAGYDLPAVCPDQAVGYVYRDGISRPSDVIRTAALRPAGLISANASDLARFARLLLGYGSLDGQQVVAREAIDMIATPRAAIPGERRSYGFGLFIADRDGRRILSHNGDELGTSSSLTLVPADNVAVLVLSNAPGRLARTVETALRLATGRTVEVGLPNLGVPLTLTPDDFRRLPGDYGRYVISRRGDELTIAPKVPFVLRFKDLGRVIIRYADDTFAFHPEAPGRPPTRFAVVRGTGGEVEYISLRGRAFRRHRR